MRGNDKADRILVQIDLNRLEYAINRMKADDLLSLRSERKSKLKLFIKECRRIVATPRRDMETLRRRIKVASVLATRIRGSGEIFKRTDPKRSLARDC